MHNCKWIRLSQNFFQSVLGLLPLLYSTDALLFSATCSFAVHHPDDSRVLVCTHWGSPSVIVGEIITVYAGAISFPDSIDSSRKAQMWFPLLRHENVTEGCVSCSVIIGLEILKKIAFFTGQGEGETGGRHLLW